MKKEKRTWDARQAKRGRSAEAVADDTLIAWPAMLKLIDDNHMGNVRVLDYHCGAGGFCRHMHSSGLRVEGIDPSPAMIRSALKRSSRKIRYHVGDKEVLKGMKGAYDVITSLMDFHYMDDLETYLPLFQKVLKERGIVVFAVFNPDFIESCQRANMVFQSGRSKGEMLVSRMETAAGTVDAYVRSKDQYKRLFDKHGFEFLSSHYPPFTPDFIAKYGWKLPSEDAEYLLMAVRKR